MTREFLKLQSLFLKGAEMFEEAKRDLERDPNLRRLLEEAGKFAKEVFEKADPDGAVRKAFNLEEIFKGVFACVVRAEYARTLAGKEAGG